MQTGSKEVSAVAGALREPKMQNVSENKISPELESQVIKILGVRSALDAPDLNTTDYINRLFPNEQSLASVDTVLEKLGKKTREMTLEAERLTGAQFEQETKGTQELEAAKRSIEELFQKIQDIKQKAAQSEAMVQEITQDVKTLDYAKRHLTYSVTVLKRLQMLVMAVDQLENMSRNKRYKESSQLLQAVIQLMQHFKTYRSVAQIAQVSNRISRLQTDLERCVLTEFDHGFDSDGNLKGNKWLLRDVCLVASVLGEKTINQVIRYFVDRQLAGYRQIFRPSEEVSQLDNISRRYAFLKRLLKNCDENYTEIFPPEWCVAGRLCEDFCKQTRQDLETVLASNNQLDVKDLLKALQLTVDFEAQLVKRFEKQYKSIGKDSLQIFEKSISSSFQAYLYLYIEAEDRTLTNMINSYMESDTKAEDDGSMVVLPSSTDLFYFYRETLVQCARFSTGKTFRDLCQLFAKHLVSYCNVVLLGGVSRNEKLNASEEHNRFISLALNTADYCCMTTSQLEEKLKETIDQEYENEVDLEHVKEAFMSAVSACIDAIVRNLENACDALLQQMQKLPWSTLDTVGDQSEYVSQLHEIIQKHSTVVGRSIANKRYFRTFSDRFVETFLSKFLLSIFRCKSISEIGAEQMLLDTHSIKTLLLDIPQMGIQGTTVPTSYSKLVNKGISKAELILKTIMTPIDPPEGYVENYIFLIADKNQENFGRLLDLKGLKKIDQTSLIEVFQRRVAAAPNDLAENSQILPPLKEGGYQPPSTQNLPSAISTSLSAIATSASNFSPQQLSRNAQISPIISSASSIPDSLNAGSRATGRFNENFRKLVMTGMAFRKDLQERRENNKQ